MVQYSRYGTSDGVKLYEGLTTDPIRAITSALIYNLGTRNFDMARTDYRRLVNTIHRRDRHGKDIRYAARELNELSKSARLSGADETARLAAMYADQLPKPQVRRRERIPDLEFILA